MNQPGKHASLSDRFKKSGGLLLSLVSIILVFAALETFQRVKDYIKWRKLTQTPYVVRFETWSGLPLTERGGSLVVKHHPHLIYKFKESQRRPEATLNALGFRGEEWRDPETKNCRIAVVGGSAAFGQGASSDESVFTTVLKRLLNRSENGGVEILNAGVIGYDSTQELVLITTVLLDYHPDLIIIFDAWNDFYNSGVQPPGMKQAISGIFHNFDEILSRNTQRWMNIFRTSSFLRWAEERVSDAMRRTTRSRKFDNYSDNLSVYLPRYKKNLERMIRLARAHDSEIIIVPQPELFQRKGQIPSKENALRAKFSIGRQKGYADLARQQYPAYVKAASDAARAHDVAFVDSSAAFDKFDGVAFVDFVHFGDEGHERLAYYLLPTVSRVLNERVSNDACHPR